MTQTAVVIAKDYDLDEAKAGEIQQAFAPMIAERKVIAKEYKAIITLDIDADVCKRAARLRKDLVKVRTGIGAVHKTQKHLFLQAGRFVDAWKNAETLPVTQMEEKLRGIEEHYENIEKDRIAKISYARVELLRKYDVADEHMPSGLGVMEEAVWTHHLAGTKAAYDTRIAAEAKAEEERIAKEKAEAEDRERIRVENVKLKKEAEAREKAEKVRKAAEMKATLAREKAEKARAAKEAAARKKFKDAADAKLKAERAAADAKIAEERKAREKLELAAKEASDKLKQAEQERVNRKINKDYQEHRASVALQAFEGLMEVDDDMTSGLARRIVQAIVDGDIPNVTINY
jgi:hypothetical protein